ncbi:hypothetical protein GE21DRAFT_6346 [Neurospora crassa]|uniref:AAA+ ATPase domain-containing protein n=1 Tax=Neurospora crassa (strain ATCC 24698 / 74-OR23-1A / CBS 708.71 / DSM 1257 / FGSC 987) TaxID=367110 RepID=Q7SA30_NEUCR|nr:hypothetical protein NCU07333 [Neurospora crassa OR74A]EAA33255.2 hypothetical protein NCU07333 [Neurospora crassa OR74A]KHE88767.1 hypothetical protein GE21DRAFT_6346 [Neurospora crassa]|eukprot:XP_962491.2 hypothetical protein NCU07333 [Neurospora crassa OR74A]
MPSSCSSLSSFASTLDSFDYHKPAVSTSHPRRGCGSVWILEQDSLKDMPANIQVMQATGCTNAEAVRLLEKTNGNIHKAVACLPGKDEWDFNLPRVKVPEKSSSAMDYEDGFSARYRTNLRCYEFTSTESNGHDTDDLSLDKLVADVQRGVSCTVIRSQLTRFRERMGPDKTCQLLNGLVKGFPGLFYVVQSRNVEMVRMWAEYGGDVNTTYGKSKFPLIAYAIILGTSYETDTTALLKALLSAGASVACIPEAFHTPLSRDLMDDGPPIEESGEIAGEHQKWCSPYVRKRLTDTLNFRFEQRYFLHRAAFLGRLSGAKNQVAKFHKAGNLLGIYYNLIGQTAAITHVIDHLISDFALQKQKQEQKEEQKSKPVVLLFAGPSGHGKTEFARSLGKLSSRDLETVDCTSMRYKTDLWGPFHPFQGWENGSALSNFLENHTSQECIVFLDEFEKTKEEVRESLLKPFDEGTVPSRKNPQVKFDCSKTTWILATNVFDNIIHDFCKRHAKDLFSDKPGENEKKLIRKLSKMIQKESIQKLGAPLSGRIAEFVPFLTFSHCEQAAMADRLLAEFGREIIQPVKESTVPSQARLVGDINVQVRRSYSVCRVLATDGYIPELGARSIANTVTRDISLAVVNDYLDKRERVHENQGRCTYVVGVNEDDMIDVSEAPSN